MADVGRLTNQHYVGLASKIGVRKMEKIALGKLNLDQSAIDNIMTDHQGDSEKQSREMVRKWAYRPENSEHQIIKLAKLLYEAAKDGDIDSYDVFEVLGVKRDDALAFTYPAPAPPASATTHAQSQPSPSVNNAAATTPSSEKKALTAKMKKNLAKRITSNDELNTLGIDGFKMEQFEVDQAKKNHPQDIGEAALKLITVWSSDYGDDCVAYDALSQILKDIRKSAWLKALN